MRNLFLTAALTIALGSTALLTGCATYVPPENAKHADIRAEAESITRELNCKWRQMPDPSYPAKGKDFACVADTFASVILFVEPSNTMVDGVPQVEKIKLVWKEWNESVKLSDSKRDASRFIAYVAQRFFPAEDAPRLVDMFFGNSDSYMDSGKLDVKYMYRKQPALNLHRMEITNQDPERKLYTFDAPHQVPSADGELSSQ